MTPTPRVDPVALHILKELPPWVVIGLFVAAFLIVWNMSHDDFIPRIIDGLVGALLTSIVAQRPKQTPTTAITADTVETPALNAEMMPDAVVNAETFNVKDAKKK